MLIVSTACWSILFTLIIVSNSNAQAPVNQSNWWCPNQCKCIKTPPLGQRLICAAMDIQLVPCPSSNSTQHIIPSFVYMDLSHNNVTRLDDFSFRFYPNLEVLKLSGNRLSEIADDAFLGLSRLSELYLQENELEHIPAKAFEPLLSLEKLHIGKNRIRSIAPTAFQSLPLIRHLYLEKNALLDVPVLPISLAPTLAVLSLADNKIERLADWSFLNSSRLQMLSLASNSIRFVAENAFMGLALLETLELQHNSLAQIPSAIQLLPALRKLSVAFNQVTHVSNEAFKHNMQITHVDILGNPVTSVGRFAFHNLTQLKILIIPEARELNRFPDVNGSRSLEFLRIDRAHLRRVPDDLCEIARNLKTLDLKSNDLTSVPRLDTCFQLRQLQLSNNKIRSLDGALFRHQNLIHDLLLSNNIIEAIPADAFVGLDKLEILNLMGNHVQMIHPDAFLPLKKLVFLNVAENAFPILPSRGLDSLLQLHAFNIPQLRDFPPPDSLPKANTLKLSYAYHCCQFMASLTTNGAFGRAGGRNPSAGSSMTTSAADSSSTKNHAQNGQTHTKGLQETVVWLPRDKVDLSLWSTNSTDIWPAYHNLTPRLGDFAEDLWGSLGPDYVYPSNLPQVVEEYFEDGRVQLAEIPHRPAPTVTCTPLPGPFMPCEDLFDWWTLRCGVWIVFLLSMLGNGAVVFVLVFSRSKMDVPRFLVCNLAGADLLMGVYLGFLAVVDASTLGQFKMHALRWQYSVGCQLAGFLGVLSSELGVFTLAVITLERNYAITHAMHLNKRLSLRHASYIMATGWAFATITASLPLFGISDYRRFAICLPFDTSDSWALAYVVFLMSANGIAFLILMGCYLKMYCAIRGSQAWNSNDSRIAKRMALLVFTDFLCWAPIAFFSLTAAFGLNLVSLEEAKVFTVFVLPLNSCANPFLYAILTKQFKKDCVLICKAIEESRVTRGIGRCRHSSNFSNRQTPANTNSLVDRNSSNTTPAVACNCSLHGPITLGSRAMLPVGEAGPGTMARLLVSGGTTIASSAVVLGATGSHHLHHHQHHVHQQQTHHHVLRHLHKKQELNESEATGSGSASACEVGSGVLLTTSAVTGQVPGRGLDVAAGGRHHQAQRLGHVRRSAVRAFLARLRCSLLCHAVLDEEPVDSAAEYAFALAELQKSQQKHSRNLSVSSSDNFSSSRSDSWRQPSVNRGRPLDRAARRNSWSVSRKPSQDSNLSSSRNDSSATTASTSTWRVSRSSVSSGDAAAAAAAANHGHLRPDSPPASTAVQANSSCNSASVPANGTNPSHDLDWLPPDTPPSHPSVRFVLPGEQVVSAPQATTARPKPKLRRQVAMSEEHSPPQALTSMFLCGRGERDKEREREVFVTRKLSTISSKSGNLYGDMVSADVEQAATTLQGSESDALLTRPCPPTVAVVAGISEDDGHLETEPFLKECSGDGTDEIKESTENMGE